MNNDILEKFNEIKIKIGIIDDKLKDKKNRLSKLNINCVSKAEDVIKQIENKRKKLKKQYDKLKEEIEEELK